jgi:DNA-binding MarR family transcriptional regulator
MGVSEVTMSRFVQALQRENWISRSQNPEDGRSLLLAPTKKARKSFPGFVDVSNEVLDTLFTGFSDNDMWSFHELVSRIRANLEARTSKSDIDKL